MDLIPIAGETVVNIDSIKNLSRLRLEFPPEEFVNIAAPQIGLVIDGVETVYEISKESGLAEVILNLQDGIHSYDVNLYNGNILIGRSKQGTQSLDLVQGDDLIIDIISLQADITIDFNDSENARFLVNIPEEAVTDVGGMENLKLLVRITDGDDVGAAVQEVVLDVQENNGQYFVEHVFDETTNNDITTYIEFRDVTTGTPEVIATCSDSVTVLTINTMTCGVGIPKDYIIGGNLLATLSVNVLNESKVAEAGADVFINGNLAGVTGSNFGTDGFIKHFVKAGEEYTVRAEKNGLEDSRVLTPSALSINNFDLILKAEEPGLPVLGEGTTCKIILDSGNSQGSGAYRLDVDGTGSLDSFVTYCDMDTKGGGWTLVQNRAKDTAPATIFNLYAPVVFAGSRDQNHDYIGSISDSTWNKLKETATELQFYSGTTAPPEYFYTTVEHLEGLTDAECKSWRELTSLTGNVILHYEEFGCNFNGLDYSFYGALPNDVDNSYADVYEKYPAMWLEATKSMAKTIGTSFYIR